MVRTLKMSDVNKGTFGKSAGQLRKGDGFDRGPIHLIRGLQLSDPTSDL